MHGTLNHPVKVWNRVEVEGDGYEAGDKPSDAEVAFVDFQLFFFFFVHFLHFTSVLFGLGEDFGRFARACELR